MTSQQGTLSSYFNLSTEYNIIINNGNTIPIRGIGQYQLPSLLPPMSLKNVLHAPKLVKNLISVRKFTTDNSMSLELDPFFFMKDF